jgi:hypothetical protein
MFGQHMEVGKQMQHNTREVELARLLDVVRLKPKQVITIQVHLVVGQVLVHHNIPALVIVLSADDIWTIKMKITIQA